MKKRRIHKRTNSGRLVRFRAGLAAHIGCTVYTIDKRFTSWAWKNVTCLPCLRKRPS